MTLDDAINYAAAFASGGMNQLKAAIRQKAAPMNESKFPNAVGLWKKGEGVYVGYGEYDGQRVHEAILIRSDRDSGPYARLYLRIDGNDTSARTVAIWRNDDKLGNAKDMPGHFVNVYIERNKKSPNSPDVSVKFVEKEAREPAGASAPVSSSSDPFDL